MPPTTTSSPPAKPSQTITTSQATTPQSLHVVLLSEAGKAEPRRYERLNSSTVEELRNYLRANTPHQDGGLGSQRLRETTSTIPSLTSMSVIPDALRISKTGTPSEMNPAV